MGAGVSGHPLGMDTWEHLRLTIARDRVGGGASYAVLPYQPGLENLHVVNDDRTVEMLDKFGAQGWRLVAVDVPSDTFWMTRPKS